MKKLLIAAMAVGCSSAASTPMMQMSAGDESPRALSAPAPGRIALRDAPDSVLPSFDAETLGNLPQAPWARGQLAAADAPSVVIAWANAENRSWCAPLAPTAHQGVSGRSSDLDGGWAVEFDQPGMPGVDERGELCDDCGRGVFGIAGTSMGVGDMLAAPTPSYADGSATEVVEDGVAAATIAIRGQGCVYQVWSFLGREHLEGLVGQLRFIDLGEGGSDTLAGLDIPFED